MRSLATHYPQKKMIFLPFFSFNLMVILFIRLIQEDYLSQERSLYIFAHQDDEVFALPAIIEDLALNVQVHCVYTTNGGFYKVDPKVRNLESLKVLSRTGVSEAHIRFAGTELEIPDGSLHRHIKKITSYLLTEYAEMRFTSIYVTAWEGGHHDHDVTFAIGRQLSLIWGTKNFWQFFLYNGEATPWKLFRVAKPNKNSSKLRKIKLTWHRKWSTLLSVFQFRTQIKTWVVLFPEFSLRLLFSSYFYLDGTSHFAIFKKPPLYQRMNRCTLAEIVEALTAQEFIDPAFSSLRSEDLSTFV